MICHKCGSKEIDIDVTQDRIVIVSSENGISYQCFECGYTWAEENENN